MTPTRIVFMGTPDFSVPALTALADQDDFDIVLVVTQPDRPKGRGKKLSPSPVKEKALELGVEIYQPEKLNTPEGLERLSALEPDYFVVVAFGQILSQAMLEIPKKYPVNIHASLLPKYRGAAPIQAAVLNMDPETGVTTMVMAKGMDTGDMLLKSTTPIDPEETAQDLHDRLSLMGAELIVETIRRANQDALTPVPQDRDQASYVSMLKKSDGLIDWAKSPQAVCAHINAMTPWPGAFTGLNGKRIKIFKAVPRRPDGRVDGQAGRQIDDQTDNQTGGPVDDLADDLAGAPGEILCCGKEGICVAVIGGTVLVTELMGSSGKRMAADAFLRGNPIDLPARFQKP